MENQLANPDFKDQVHYAPFQEFDQDGKRQWQDLMSGNWAWSQVVSSYSLQVASQGQVTQTSARDIIAKDPDTHSAMFAPIIVGSDKTTVLVATGQNEYYPIYASLGNVHNSVG